MKQPQQKPGQGPLRRLTRLLWGVLRGLAILAAGLVGLVVLLYLVSPLYNNGVAAREARRLAALPLPEAAEQIETVSRAGKLVGNGNGMQYLGAMLLYSELPIEELAEYYGAYGAEIAVQQGSEIEFVEHGSVAFAADPSGTGYYTVYSWGRNDTVFDLFDLRGH